jgi:site-specific recombinase XerD
VLYVSQKIHFGILEVSEAHLPQLRFLEPHEVEKLLDVPHLRANTGMRNRVIMQLMWETGMRVGETLALRSRDVLLSEKKVTVLLGKGGKTRVVYWRSAELSMLIGKWKERRPKSKLLFPTVRSESGKGEPIEHRSFRLQFARYVEAAELPKWVTPHVLRHSFATDFLNRGGNVRTLQIILGHSSLATTEKYLHVTDKDVAFAMRGY